MDCRAASRARAADESCRVIATARCGSANGFSKQAQLELDRQHTPHGAVEVRHRDVAALHQVAQARVIVAKRQVHLHTGAEGGQRGFLGRDRDMMHALQETDTFVIRHHQAGEAQLFPEHLAQQPGIGVRGQAVHFVVGWHDGHRGRLGDNHAEGPQMGIEQLTRGHHPGAPVDAPLGLTVSGQVLERCRHPTFAQPLPPLPLESPNGGHADAAVQKGIFARRFIRPAPARVPADVHHRGEGVVNAPGAHLGRHHGVNPLDQILVPGASQTDGCGKGRRPRHQHAVATLVMEQRRDAQAGLLAQIALNRIAQLDLRHRLPPDRAQLADAVREECRSLVRLENAVGGDRLLELPETAQLRHFFLEIHAAQQILDAPLDRQ